MRVPSLVKPHLVLMLYSTHAYLMTTFPSGYSAFAGLIMALKDPKVPIFAVMTCAQLLGLGFVNFFPTCVAIEPNLSRPNH